MRVTARGDVMPGSRLLPDRGRTTARHRRWETSKDGHLREGETSLDSVSSASNNPAFDAVAPPDARRDA
jgi:hypothetical protein